MPQDVTKKAFSASTNGKRIKVTATSSPGTTIHTVTTTVGTVEDIYLDMVNNHTAAVDVHVEFGGTTDPDDVVHYYGVPAKTAMAGAIPLHRGSLIGAASPPVVKVWASVANVITIGGDVNSGA